jgi:outer membrane receptor protein involved in Fe transport
MRKPKASSWVFLVLATCSSLSGQDFGTVRGTVVDPQQAVVPGAQVRLIAQMSAYTQEATTDVSGEFTAAKVPAGEYEIQVSKEGFQTVRQMLTVSIGAAPVLKFSLSLEAVKATTEVTASFETTNPEASSPPVTVTQTDLMRTPGAERTSSLAFITNYAPGAYMLHDHLHIRGGHEVSWVMDGVPIPNTNISTNVGRAMDPKDIESVEVSRGGYSARYGDRTYGVVNVITKSGFEFENEGELTLSYGSYNQTNDQISFGGHSSKFAYYASVSGSRTDLGLEPPTEQAIHNMGSALGSFTSLNYNLGANDQLRLNASVRQDHYQIPNFPAEQALGYRDIDQEKDSFVNFSWVHTLSPGALLTISPFYHYNQSLYDGAPGDPLLTTAHRTSNYEGAQALLGLVHGDHNFQTGIYGFAQNDQSLFSLGGRQLTASETQAVSGGVATLFFDEQFKPTEKHWDWLTVNAGIRMTHFSGLVNENAATPRLGVSAVIPKIKWVARGFWGRYYQPPPLSTIGGGLLNFALLNHSFGFLPLHGERDRQWEYGLSIPMRGWVLDLDHFRTDANNFADHDVLGNSNITLPLSVEYVRVRGWEVVLRSPQVWKRVRFHLAYSNQVVKGRGQVTGGLTDFKAPGFGYFYIDHDQRNTASAGAQIALPGHAYVSGNVNYGSGFLDVNGPEHLPPHTTGDFSIGKTIGQWNMNFTALNVSNSRYLLGRDSAFAGTHFNDPRQFMVQVKYRFHF